MDKNKKKRSALRGVVTKVIAEMDQDDLEVETLKLKLDMLLKYEKQLDELNEKILDALLEIPGNEQNCSNEMDRARAVSEEVRRAANRAIAATTISNSTIERVNTAKVDLRLPKIELEKFDLCPSNWINFWSQFKRIEDDKNIDCYDKIVYLKMCLLGQAKKLVDNYPNSPENYVKALQHLKKRFGRDDLVIHSIYKDLLQLVRRGTGDLVSLYDNISCKLRSLETLGLNQERAEILVPLIEECLPADVLKLWERYRLEKEGEEDEDTPPSDDEASSVCSSKSREKVRLILSFLGKEAESEQRMRASKMLALDNHTGGTAAALTAVEPNVKKCVFCGEAHFSQNCRKNIVQEDRRKILSSLKLCFVCFRPSHAARDCRSKVECRKCKGRHYDVMCPRGNASSGAVLSSCSGTRGDRGSSGQGRRKERTENMGNEEASANLLAGPCGSIMLQTVIGRIGDRVVRILLDSGSHRSYISSKLVSDLQMQSCGQESMRHLLFGGVESANVVHNLYNITVHCLKNDNTFQFQALNQDKICGRITPVNLKEIRRTLIANKIVLSDDGVDRPIECLIGADQIARLVSGMRRLDGNLIAFDTLLGWSVIGSANSDVVINNTNLSFGLCNFWGLEALGIEPQENIPTPDSVVKQFNDNIAFVNGRYEVALPWIDGHPTILDERDLAENRLKQVLKRLEREGLYDTYDDVFQGWENDGIIEQVAETNEVVGHYLPHRPVIKEGKTTKVRPVFDASAKSVGHVSLNECLHTGPNMIADILKLLLKFRVGKVGLIADVKQAFLMIGLAVPSDKDMLRFLWWRDGKMIVYRHCRVVFGVVSSPFLLNATIAHHLTTLSGEWIDKLKGSFYMDDCICSFDNLVEAQLFKEEAIEVMKKASFELRGWVMTGDSDENAVLVLGTRWNAEKDLIGCTAERPAGALTKRRLLSFVHKVYDPLGLLAAPMLTMKILLREVFQLKLDWDVSLPKEIELKCGKWLNDINLIEGVMVPRCIDGRAKDVRLHAFSDASMNGFGVCIFSRYRDELDNVQLKFVAAKSRVTPMGKMTIPRKELVAALLSARLGSVVSVATEIDNITYWTDSMIVLYWIKKGEWKTFVGNRVKEVRRLTEQENWRFVPGDLNCADIVSRGCGLMEFVDLKWWEGPQWLKTESENWPVTILTPTREEESTAVVNTLINLDGEYVDRFVRFNSFSKNVRVLAYVRRFVNNLKECREARLMSAQPSERYCLSDWQVPEAIQAAPKINLEEFTVAESVLIRLVQQAYLTDVGCFDSFIDDAGLVRVRTKILSNQFEAEFREPILIPRCKVAEDLVREKHEEMHHAGATIVLGLLRDRHWIVNGRRIARGVIKRCVRCRRFKARPLETTPVGLPHNRVNLGKAFQISGCDLAGPLFLRGGEKVWIVLFTCAVYRAVHLELVDSLATEAFVMALRRFVARRGRVEKMYSDNGTNFVGAWNLIEKCEVETRMKVQWIFSPPTGAWWGGFWERLIGVMKSLLRVSLGRALLSLVELNTVLIEVEALVNSRPLTYCSEDPSELKPLTPAMFLQEESATVLPEVDCIDRDSVVQRVRYVHDVREQLKERFWREYLGQLLLSRSKESDSIQEGEVVILMSDQKKAVDWSLARVVEVYPGKDGVVRVVKLKTANGEVLRPVQRLCKLEVGSVFPKEVSEHEFDSTTPTAVLNEEENEETSVQVSSSPQKVSVDAVDVRTSRGRTVRKPNKLDL